MQNLNLYNIISRKYSKKGIIIRELSNTGETRDKKNILEKIEFVLTIIGCVFIVFMIPFIYTIFANVLIELGAIESIEQLENCNKIFKYFNIIIIVSLAILIMYESKVSVSDIIQRIANNFDFSYKKGDSEITVTHTETLREKNITKIAREVKEEAHDEIIKGESTDEINKCQECKILEVIEERESLRYFSAYQVTNKYSRELLKFIKNNDKIDKEIFRNNLIEYYDKNIRNMGKKRKQEFISRKIDEVLYNLRYLNIIEYTEDDKYIILTQNGIEFVKGYEEVG